MFLEPALHLVYMITPRSVCELSKCHRSRRKAAPKNQDLEPELHLVSLFTLRSACQ